MAHNMQPHSYPNYPPAYSPVPTQMPAPKQHEMPPQNHPQMYPQIPAPASCPVIITNVTGAAPAQAPAQAQVHMGVMGQVGQHPATTVCRSCNMNIVTRVDRSTSNSGNMWALFLCLIGCWPCCLFPYCMDSCQNAKHYCPNCSAYIGEYRA